MKSRLIESSLSDRLSDLVKVKSCVLQVTWSKNWQPLGSYPQALWVVILSQQLTSFGEEIVPSVQVQ